MMLFTKKLASRLYLETKRGGLLTVTARGRDCAVYGLEPGNKMVYTILLQAKRTLRPEKFQPGLLNGDMMSPTTGNGGVNKCF